MYRLVFTGLVILAIISIIFGFASILPYGGVSLLFSALSISVICYVANYVFAKLYKVQANAESVWITALILFFTLLPLSSSVTWDFLPLSELWPWLLNIYSQ